MSFWKPGSTKPGATEGEKKVSSADAQNTQALSKAVMSMKVTR